MVQQTSEELGVLKGTLSNWIRSSIDLLILKQELIVDNEVALLREYRAIRDSGGE